MHLTERQKTVGALLCKGYSAKMIASETGWREQIVKDQVIRLRRRLKARNSVQAAVLFDRLQRRAGA